MLLCTALCACAVLVRTPHVGNCYPTVVRSVETSEDDRVKSRVERFSATGREVTTGTDTA